MRRASLLLLTLLTACTSTPPSSPIATPDTPSRTFRLTYAFTVHDLPPHQAARIWIPIPHTTTEQRITHVSLPASARTNRDTDYHNTIAYLELAADDQGRIPVSVSYTVQRFQVTATTPPPREWPTDSTLFLSANRLVPVGGKSSQLVAGEPLPSDPAAAAKRFYDVVDDHLTYRKDQPGWGRGDSDWACDSKFGNCTDFHSMFISLARAQHIPARFDIGFLLPEARSLNSPKPLAGYHCWAFAAPTKDHWLPVDISEANQHPEQRAHNFGTLTPDRVALSTGRDIHLVPMNAGGPLNFFVYPYIEVAGKPYDNVDKQFSYQDLP